MTAERPLDGLRVLELGQLIAGPFAGTMLGYYGAEVVKIEPPGGDPIRRWRLMDGDTSWWWYSIGRNKRSVVMDLKQDAARGLIRRMARHCDVLIENFRPGTLERWGLGPEQLHAENPGLVIARISGYGQDGPYAERPGYASVCEGMGGFRYVNGQPGEPPVRPNLSMGDTLAGMHAVIGILLALVARARHGRGEVVDVALTESVFNLLEAVVPEYHGAGAVREPSGSTVTGIVPTNTYPCRDGRHVIIGGNGDSIYRRLMTAAGRADLAADTRLQDNAGRVVHQVEIDDAIAQWTQSMDMDEVLRRLGDAEVPAGPIYSVADMIGDAQFRHRNLFETVQLMGRTLKIPAIAPRLQTQPGRTDHAGPRAGADTREVLNSWLGMTAGQLDELLRAGVVFAQAPLATDAQVPQMPKEAE